MREVIWLKNYNNKRDCESFIHVDFAPEHHLPESVFPAKRKIIFQDGTEPLETYLLFLVRIPLKKLPDMVTLASHNCPAIKFMEEKMKDEKVNFETEVAVYLYSTDLNNKDYFLPLF